MRRASRTALTLVALGSAAAACARPQRDIRTFAQNSDFVFRGTTILPRASTIDAEDVSNLAIVRVDEIVSGAAVFQNLTGQRITVRLQNPAAARAGNQRIFFTKGWHYGESIGVVEVGAIDVPVGETDKVRSDVQRAVTEQQDVELRRLLDSAELVVGGRVTAVRKANITPRIMTEHDPNWYEADIRSDTVFKGAAPQGGTVTILFPNTDDPMWYGVPRLSEGTDGIFLLHRFDFAGQRLPRLVISRRGDLQPRPAAPRIRRLLQR